VSEEKGAQLIRELLNFGPMNDDDTRRTRLEEGMRELETRMGQPAPLAQPLQKALLGAVFPLSTEQLVWLARENEAPPVVLSLLSNLPGRLFESLDAVQQVLEAQPGPGEEAAEDSAAPMQER
jgi:hypothetical protein